MATRAAAHAAAADAAPTQPMSHLTAPSASADGGAPNAPAAATQIASHVALDASAYEPSPSISAYANAAAVAASTAVLSPAPVSVANTSTLTARSRTEPSVSASSLPVTPSALTPLTPPRSKLGSSRPSSKFGTVNYSVDEMRRLNDKVRTLLPVTSEDWLHVAYQFNYMRPESIPYRDVESLKRKFKKMYCTRSSASGKLPAYAQDAKELRRLINQRSERAQIQVDHTQSDSQSEIDAQDVASAGGGGSDERSLSVATGSDAGQIQEDTAGAEIAQTEVTATVPPSVEVEMETSVGADDTRDLATRLRLMEDEYHRSMVGKRSTSDAMGALYADHSLVGLATGAADTTTTTGIINLLKHSIERKRRTMEEQLVSESERVRKERKKRKMEQVLYNIHREQTGGGGGTVSAGESTVSPGGTTASAAAFQHNLLAAATAASPSGTGGLSLPLAPPLAQDATASLGVMEIVLQFMVTQQQETTRRIQQDDERRRIQEEDRVRRRRLKDTQRRKDKHEMMLVMAALLQESFPEELRQYLDPASVHSDDDENVATTAATANGAITAKPKAPDGNVPSVEDRVTEAALL